MKKTLIPIQIDMASLTDPGMIRSHNEDNHALHPELGLVILADGMGGYNAGEVASEMAVEQLSHALETALATAALPHDRMGMMARQIVLCNAAIHRASQTRPQCHGMGTTLVAAMFHEGRVTVAHVGDSRLYRWRGGQLERVTRDHSLLQEQLDSGLLTPEEAAVSANKNLVTRALGVDSDVTPEVHQYDTAVGDLYLLCSDGLNDMVADDEIARILAAPAALQETAAQLVQTANANGGRDNVTVVLVRVLDKAAPAAQGALARLASWIRPHKK